MHPLQEPGVSVRTEAQNHFASLGGFQTRQTSNNVFTPEVKKRLVMNGIKGSGVLGCGTCLKLIWETLGFNAKQNMARGSKALLLVLQLGSGFEKLFYCLLNGVAKPGLIADLLLARCR
ncbi:MAG: hypothetical protein C0469_15070 [Cyanobacteria bacterium DS2.3.42]|nr:hypothetical protein [Cyanobacteria bacterium DS2.3.42]